MWLGRFGDDAADEAVLAVQRTEPVPWLELHCHGGGEVVGFLLETLENRGVEVCSWQELERRTADKPFQAEAAAALAEAVTVRAAAILLDQYHGAFERGLQDILAALERGDAAMAGQLLERLAQLAPLGRHLAAPWRVVVAGAPNVGKSSLVNALAGYQRSIVAATPGTTRDVVTTIIAVAGWAVELADTAGLRPEAGEIEALGIDRAQAALVAADLVLWVLDGSDVPIVPTLPAGHPQFVINKSDLPAAWDFQRFPQAVAVSSLTGAGMAELCRALADWLVPQEPPPGGAVPFTPAWCGRVEQASQQLAGGDPLAVQRTLRGDPA